MGCPRLTYTTEFDREYQSTRYSHLSVLRGSTEQKEQSKKTIPQSLLSNSAKVRLLVESPGIVCSQYCDYRYGFQGQEKDDEIKGKGNSYDFGARMYDSRLGRWLSIDALASEYPSLSDYVFVANRPLTYVDLDGNEIVYGEGNSDKFNRKIKRRIWIMKTFGPKELKKRINDVIESETQINVVSSDKIDGGFNKTTKTVMIGTKRKMFRKTLAVKDSKKGTFSKLTLFGTIANEFSHAEDLVNDNTKEGVTILDWGGLLGGHKEETLNEEIESTEVDNLATGMFFWMGKRDAATHYYMPTQSWSGSDRRKYKRVVKLYAKDDVKGTKLLDKFLTNESIGTDAKRNMKLWTKGDPNYSPKTEDEESDKTEIEFR